MAYARTGDTAGRSVGETDCTLLKNFVESFQALLKLKSPEVLLLKTTTTTTTTTRRTE